MLCIHLVFLKIRKKWKKYQKKYFKQKIWLCIHLFICVFKVPKKLFIEERYNSNMSLNDLDKEDEEYEDLAPRKRKGKGIRKKIFSKTKIFLIILIVGILIGVMLGHYYIEPILSEAEGSSCKSCLVSKELLTKEHDCLYSLIQDTDKINSCNPLDSNS